MFRFICRRLLLTLPVLFGVISITFGLLYLLPGDPAATMLARSGASAQQVAELRASLGLDRPLAVQFFSYIGDIARGDLGSSLASNESVLALLADRLPRTLALVLAALAIAIPLGTLMGVVAAIYRDKFLDRLLSGIAALGVSVPSFWSGLMLILIFAVGLRWLPASGAGSWQHLVLPATVLALGAIGTIARTARASMLEALRQDFIRTARAKGLRESTIIWRHALPNALIPVVTIIGLQFGWLISGSFIVEEVFSRQGLGTLLINAILDKDLPIVQGVVLVTAVLYVSVNLLVDLAYGLIDPRIRYD